MSGKAKAEFRCGARSYGGEGARPDYSCGEAIVMPLINDGQYTSFVAPQNWHIELGYDPNSFDAKVVRCPQHCRWTKNDSRGNALAGGEWEDSP